MAVVAIDFDSTLVDNEYKPLPGARDAISRLRELGHKIIIHSCNNPDWIEKVMNNHDIRYDLIWGQTASSMDHLFDKRSAKPIADLYIDDKGYHFPYNGDWNSQMDSILARLEGKDNRKW